MNTYAELPKTRPFLERVIDRSNSDMGYEELVEQLDIRTNEETQILNISVSHEQPVQALNIANVIGQELVKLSPSESLEASVQTRKQVIEQISELENSAVQIEASIDELKAAFENEVDAAAQRLLLDQLTSERNRLSDNDRTLALMYETAQQVTTNQVKIVEPARRAVPVDNQALLKIMIGVLTGFVLSAVMLIVYEYVWATVSTGKEMSQATDAPFLGVIRRGGEKADQSLTVRDLPDSASAEDFRNLGVRLMRSADGRARSGSILVSHLGAQTNAGTFVANLGFVLSQMGHRVVLVDANLHHPSLGALFGLSDATGLTHLLNDPNANLDLTPIEVNQGLSVLPSGSVANDSFKLLASGRMTQIMQQLTNQADVVLIAGSPLATEADSLLLSSKVDGVLIPVISGKNRPDAVKQVVADLRAVGAQIIGLLLSQPTANDR